MKFIPRYPAEPLARHVIRTAVLSAIVSAPASASAMNWEGHDDWMLDFEPGFTLESFAPEARPLPKRDCPVTKEDVAKNPYEQIPLPRHNCPRKVEPRR